MIHRPNDGNASAANAISHGEQVVERVDVERKMLHGASCNLTSRCASVGHAKRANSWIVGMLLKRNVATRAQLDEPVERVLNTMHPIQRFQLTTKNIGEEFNLLLDVASCQRKMVDAVRVQCHLLSMATNRERSEVSDFGHRDLIRNKDRGGANGISVGTVSTSAPVTVPGPTFADQLRGTQPAMVAVGAMVAVQWVSEVVDTLNHHRLDRFGVRPHQLRGLRGIAFAPFLHAGFGHLIGNTVPFAVLGVLIALGGIRQLASVTAIVMIVSGLGMWLFGSSNQVHIGASGVVFGYLAYLLSRGFFARNIKQIALGALVGAIYGGILWGVLPTQQGVSWQGHLFGALGGVLSAKLLSKRRGPLGV